MSQPTASQRLTAVSPSRLERLLACPLRVAFEQSKPTPTGSVTIPPSALVGLAAHRTIELCLADPPMPLPSAWDRACDELAERAADPRSSPGARRARLRLERRLPDLVAFIESRGPSELLFEHELVAPDHSVLGRPDLVIVGERPCVIDYKTGLVNDGGGTRPAYERQVAIYAWLVETALGVEVNEAALFSLRQGIVEVYVSTDLRSRVMGEALDAREAFNTRAPGPQPATPSEAACRWCPFVGPCDAVWLALHDGRFERFGTGEAARGVVRAPVVVAGSGVAAIPLHIDAGTVSGPATLIDVPAVLVATLAVGDRLAAWAVARQADDPLTLAWHDGVSAIDLVDA